MATKQMRIIHETLVPFDAAHRLLPGAPTRYQLAYWRRRGIRTLVDGVVHVVKLECCRVGGHPHTSREAYLRFLERINGEIVEK